MNVTVFTMLLTAVVAQPVTTATERSTRIYVRTTPPGASIVLDGEELGTSDGLFLVPPGVRKITLEMDGYDPEGKTVDVREGWITRVEVSMNRRGKQQADAMAARAPAASPVSQPSLEGFTDVAELTIYDDNSKINSLIDFDSGQLHTLPTGDEVQGMRAEEWLASKGIDAGCETNAAAPGLWGYDMVVLPVANEAWEKPSVATIEGELRDGKPGSPAIMSALGGLPRAFYFATREGSRGILQITDLIKDQQGEAYKLRYRRVSESRNVREAVAEAPVDSVSAGVLEFRVAANQEEAEAFAQNGKELGWYESLMKENDQLVTRKDGEQDQVLLWKTPEKSMTASGAGQQKWRIIEVSIMAEPDRAARIGVVFDQEGGRHLKQLTKNNIGRRLAMLVDGRVISCPRVQAALGSRAEITGNFSKAEITRMAASLQAGMETERRPLPEPSEE